MYKEHPVFKKLDDVERIWRYLDFTKFVSLLDHKALFFTRADKFDDPFEGIYSKANIELRPQVYGEKVPKEEIRRLGATLDLFAKDCKRYTTINSWHIND